MQVYMIDEPSSYLDVRQRLKAARVGEWAQALLVPSWQAVVLYSSPDLVSAYLC